MQGQALLDKDVMCFLCALRDIGADCLLHCYVTLSACLQEAVGPSMEPEIPVSDAQTFLCHDCNPKLLVLRVSKNLTLALYARVW